MAADLRKGIIFAALIDITLTLTNINMDSSQSTLQSILIDIN